MKCKVTFLAENNQPVSTLGDNPEEKVKLAFQMFFDQLSLLSPLFSLNEDKVAVLEVEVSE